MTDFTIDFAATNDECLEVHHFLCIVAQPHLIAPIDAKDSIGGILEVANKGIIINARKEGHLIGTLGLLPMAYWFNNNAEFLGNRWFFVLPQFHFAGVGVRLEAEGAAFAHSIGLPMCISSHAKRRKSANKTEPYLIRERTIEPVARTLN